MKIIIDKNGNLSFDEYFHESDLEIIKQFLKDKLRINVEVERDNERVFKSVPALWKKRNIRDIDWSDPRNIIILLKNEDKTDDEMLGLLGVPNRESSFVVVTRMRNVRQQFKAWAKELGIDDNLSEYIEQFASIYASKQKRTDNQIANDIEKMEKEGCKVFEDERFPECKEEFNSNCIICQFGKNHIKNDTDIKRFNDVLDNEFPFED